MPFDGIFMSNMCRELSVAIGSRAEKIYQPTRDDMVVTLGNRGFSKKLLISISGVFEIICLIPLNFSIITASVLEYIVLYFTAKPLISQ